MRNVLIVGYGYVGKPLKQLLEDNGNQVFVISRSANEFYGSNYIQQDIETIQPEHIPPSVDAVVFLVSPDGRDMTAYKHLYETLLPHFIQVLQASRAEVQTFILGSSTGVYDQCQGEIVSESTPLSLSSEKSRLLALGEQAVLQSGFDYTIIRFSGIYGPGRHYLVDQVKQGFDHFVNGHVYSNRIYIDDCVSVLEHILLLDNPKPLYIASDSDPTPINEILSWLHAKLGKQLVSMPAEESRVHQGGNKRCSNAQLLASGYVFRYTNYQEGFSQLLD